MVKTVSRDEVRARRRPVDEVAEEAPRRRRERTRTMGPIQMDFVFERETKNQVRYKQVKPDGTPGINTLYVEKATLGDDYPKGYSIVLTPR